MTQNGFCTAKEVNNKIKRQPMEWDNIFADTCDIGFISKISKELIKLSMKKKNPKTPNLKIQGKGR